MMKLAGCLLLALAGYGAGSWRLGQARRHLAALQQLELLLGRIRDEITFRALPLEDILLLLRTESGFGLLGLDLCSQLHLFCLPNLFKAEEREALQPAFATLGQSTGAQAGRTLAYYQKRCAAFTLKAEKELDKAKQLYRPFGLCAGLLTAFLLL